MSKYKPGDIVTIKGTEFAVLDVDNNDSLFVLLKEPVGSTVFSTDGSTNYKTSRLYKEVREWYEKKNISTHAGKGDGFMLRQIDLWTVDGRRDYGRAFLAAAPLTYDEYRAVSKYIPKCEKASWLASGYGGEGYFGDGAVMRINPDGSLGYCGAGMLNAIRPALWVSEELVESVEPEKPDLSEYSTMALLQELAEREMRNG